MACDGGAVALENGTFGSMRNLGISTMVLLIIIFFNRCTNKYLRMSSIVIGLLVGYIVSYFLGMIYFSSINSYGGINIPIPFRYGISFDISSIISLGLVFLITSIEAYGDITANSLTSGEPVEGDKFLKRTSGGILGDAIIAYATIRIKEA